MKHSPVLLPPIVRYFFFLLGLGCALGFRLIIVFQHIDPSFVRPLWYFSIIGYIFFFFYRYFIAHRRRATIRGYALVEKIEAGEVLSEDEREAAAYILSSINKSPEMINYLFIFITSLLAVGMDIWLTHHNM